jgi:MOSC domain
VAGGRARTTAADAGDRRTECTYARGGFAEDSYVGRTLRIGPKVVISVLQRDPRCKMITIDPDTAQPNPQILRTVNQTHITTITGGVVTIGIDQSEVQAGKVTRTKLDCIETMFVLTSDKNAQFAGRVLRGPKPPRQ